MILFSHLRAIISIETGANLIVILIEPGRRHGSAVPEIAGGLSVKMMAPELPDPESWRNLKNFKLFDYAGDTSSA